MNSNKVTVSTKGHIIDPNCKYIDGSILEYNNDIYDCTLNQTDLKSNKNKFYIMQIIKHGTGICCFIRYGRIGEIGVILYKNFVSDHLAVTHFEKQYKSKTGNNWHDKNQFVKKDGKYHMATMDHADISLESESEESETEDQLDQEISYFLKVISNSSYMKKTLIQLEIDTDKMPIGKISQKQIDKAYEVLNSINENLDDPDHLIKLSSDFYTLIPYSCSRSKKPPIINNKKLISKNAELLDELSQIAFGAKAIIKLKKSGINDFYQNLNTDILPLNWKDKMYHKLAKYIINSQAPTHNFCFEITSIFQINRQFEREIYNSYSKKLKNKTLLFHGTRVSNMIGILQNGLMIDASKIGLNVVVTGKMFGYGLYFADSASKSLQYCAFDSSDNIACLLIAEVALGNMLKKTKSDCTINSSTLPEKYHSTWGLGKSSYQEFEKIGKVRMPKGKLEELEEHSESVLLYDEFIVYNEQQINLKYLALLKIN